MFSFIQGEFDNVYDKKDAAKQPMILTKSNLGKQFLAQGVPGQRKVHLGRTVKALGPLVLDCKKQIITIISDFIIIIITRSPS